jgi:thioredoxin-related protein
LHRQLSWLFGVLALLCHLSNKQIQKWFTSATFDELSREGLTMITRRKLVLTSAMMAAGAAFSPVFAGAAEIGDNGLHIQEWFLESFMDLAEDRAEAAAKGKSLAVIFEQRGCPYCAEMHKVNFGRPEITDYIRANFELLQIDLWGSRPVTDFDGAEIEERQLARKWRVNFTPTIVFIKPGTEKAAPIDMEVARIPGYFKPFHFISMFEFVKEQKYAEMPFQRFLQAKFKALEEKGIKPDVW